MALWVGGVILLSCCGISFKWYVNAILPEGVKAYGAWDANHIDNFAIEVLEYSWSSNHAAYRNILTHTWHAFYSVESLWIFGNPDDTHCWIPSLWNAHTVTVFNMLPSYISAQLSPPYLAGASKVDASLNGRWSVYNFLEMFIASNLCGTHLTPAT